jgi:SH3-like domain-containing protein
MKESSPASPSPTPIPPLSLSPPPAETLKISPLSLPRGKVIWVYVNLREGPGTQYKIVGKAFMKNTFEIIAEHPDWLRVRLENGTEGWMSKKASSEISVTTSSQTPPASPHDSSKTKFSSKPPCPM